MTYVNNTRTISLVDRFNTLRADFAAARAKRKVFRATFNELSALSNRELADLGINRSQITSIAAEAAETA